MASKRAARCSESARLASAEAAWRAWSAARSAPAENARPAPVRTTTRTASSSAASASAARSAATRSAESALRLSGRSRVRGRVAPEWEDWSMNAGGWRGGWCAQYPPAFTVQPSSFRRSGPEPVERPEGGLLLEGARDEHRAPGQHLLPRERAADPDPLRSCEALGQRFQRLRELRAPLGPGDVGGEREPVAPPDQRVEEAERRLLLGLHPVPRRPEQPPRVFAHVEADGALVGVDGVGELEVGEALPGRAVEGHPE